jgi:hypothetical protein
MTLMCSSLRPLCILMMRAPADRQSRTLLHTLRKQRSHLLVDFILTFKNTVLLHLIPTFP